VLSARLEEIDWSRGGLFTFGLLMVFAGAALPAVSQANAPLIVAGSAAVAAAVILPRLQSIDLGGVLKGEFRSDDLTTTGVRTDEWTLRRFAWLVCGNAQQARELVEEALADARMRKLPASERGTQELRSLSAMLENVQAHALLRRVRARGERDRRAPADDIADEQCRPTLEALSRLPVRVRLTYLLRCSWLLSVEQVSTILTAEPAEVREATAQARQALAAVQ
jgi:DNA-directed RNA polymerase specialized sigma24 family protein